MAFKKIKTGRLIHKNKIVEMLKKKFSKVVLSVLFILTMLNTLKVDGQVTVSPIFGNHMVLQQNANIKIWGKANPNEEIKITGSFLKGNFKSISDKDGNWVIELKTPAFGGPFQLQVKGKQGQIDLNDIYLGEVWLASGQSNMQFPLDSTSKGYNGPVNFKEEIKNANYPMIRQFLVRGVIGRIEKESIKGEWVLCESSNAKKYSALAYFFARDLYKGLNVPIGIINSSWGGTSIGSWMGAKDLRTFDSDLIKLKKITFDTVKVNENYPSVLYNGMIAPITNYKIKGVIWCQGENSINDPRDYADRMTHLISGWRNDFKDENLPFLYVQIAPFNYLGRPKQWFSGTKNSLGYLVEQQTKTLSTPHVDMARTGDVGDIKYIHYRNKQDVGYRLSLLALKEVYKKKIDFVNGPDVDKISLEGNTATITYKNIGSGLVVKGESLNGFELSEDGVKFYPAMATVHQNKVIVNANQVNQVKAIRYCFNNIDLVNLFNEAGFPALPFRTDHLPYERPNSK
ncbi:hypothetical protein I5M32_11495 [Pedobacter sp. SD-b]|uniref:Sialate O-acetylesterase domain-containing protein n=1 Tax=Pedobacter segetis TaxID=2793069 RepID=A0ABS1BL15_9SPHI|nr:sialate O-acetylesterase [Pedobacter segetis]MBK0383582.1 hypothetical protein [Pedobacter segetis]